MAQAAADDGDDSALSTSNERAELAELRKKSKRLEVETTAPNVIRSRARPARS